jgi:tetratricopeptide (TPR) repeat protein
MRSVVLGLALCFLAACAARRAAREADAAFARSDYETAWRLYAERLAEDPEDEALRARMLAARRAALLDRGRDLVIARRPEGAIPLFEKLLEENPGDALAARWLGKAQRELVGRLVAEGRLAVSEERFEEARSAFESALAVLPEDEEARKEMGDLDAVLARRSEKATEAYAQGMHALGADRLFEARGGFSNTLRLAPDHARAKIREAEVSHRIVEDRIRKARALAAAGRYAAAKREAELAAALIPDSPQASDLKGTFAIETEVQDLLRRADQRMIRGDLDGARTLLEEARERTTQEGERIEGLLRDLAERSLERMYLAALDLEADRRFEEAVAAYRRLLEETPHYSDATARLDQLSDLLEHLDALYARAVEADRSGDGAGALRLYDEITALYPEYRDVAERRMALRRRGTTAPAGPGA